ncbi:phage upper tail fiber protein, partial [Streptococcus pneumoniae]|uniref:phage upper tail fiber protein n=1 Tax=Streptococcus pneumoniae TaxID=1313 RepID=UPI003D662F9C
AASTRLDNVSDGATGPAGATGARGADGARGRDGAPGQNIINQNGGQPMKYWSGTRAQYDAIPNKDSNTIYDIY